MSSPRSILAIALEGVPTSSRELLGTPLFQRVALLAILLITEMIGLSIWLDTNDLEGRGGIIQAIGTFGPYIVQAFVIWAASFLALGYFRIKPALDPINQRLSEQPFAWTFLTAHVVMMSAFASSSSILFSGTSGGLVPTTWLTTGALGFATALFFFLPPRTLREILHHTGAAWAYATTAAIAIPLLVLASQQFWKPATTVTFVLVKGLLSPFLSEIIADPAATLIGTPKFRVFIAASCSGLEGMGLMLVFGTLWLWFFRDHYKFPRALLLIPVGMALMFFMNSVRIAALVLIGNAGARAVALGGFHSQAGWIAFTAIALGLTCIAHRITWIAKESIPAQPIAHPAHNALPAYLLPFLAILAAGMIATATAGAFEWMYPLRFIAAAGTLLLFRHHYTNLSWRISWIAPTIGVLVFVLWIALDRIAAVPAGAMPEGLAKLSPPMRITWLTIRALAAIVTVPLAEELAFRGFLLRRLISSDFESVSLQRWTLFALLISSVIFGLMHGDRWIAGSVAGILYAFAQKSRGSIGDAVVAHGITNALIAGSVLLFGQWSLW